MLKKIYSKLTLLLGLCLAASFIYAQENPQAPQTPAKTVRGKMQAHPGGPMEEVEVAVHAAPVNLPIVDADKVNLTDEELVIGIVHDSLAIAFPVRFLAMYEIVDSKVGDLPVAPTW